MPRGTTPLTFTFPIASTLLSPQMDIIVPTATMVPHMSTGLGLGLQRIYPKISSRTAAVGASYVLVEPHHRSRLPRLSSALRLPSELLQEIFLVYAHLCPRRRSYAEGLRWDSWMQVTHVCRRWRSVALAFPALWTRITVVNARVARAMFHRSGELPLDVVCYVTPQGQCLSTGHDTLAQAHARLEATMEELHRIRRLKIVSTAWSRTFVSSLTWLGRPARQLESLVLDICAGPPAKKSDQIPVSTFTLFQASNLTRLKSLYLNDETHRWGTALPSSLRILEITHARLLVWEDRAWTFNAALLKALSAVPQLEQLVVVDASNAETGHPIIPSPLPHIALPHLRTITVLKSLPLPSLCLLDRLILPPTTNIRLDLLPDDDLDVPTITPLLARQLCGRTTGSVHPFQMRSFLLRCHRDAMNLVGWTEALPPASLDASSSPAPPPRPKIDVRFALDADPAAQRLQWSVLAEDVLEDVRLPGAASLHLAPLRPFTLLTDLRRALAGFARVEALCVGGWTARQLLALLHATQPFSTDAFLPRLRTLVLRAVHFPPRPRRAADGMQLALLRERLEQRAARGWAVRELVLQDCFNVNEDDAESLRAVVGKVSWDGVTQVGEAAVWKQEEVPYGVRYSWEDATEDS